MFLVATLKKKTGESNFNVFYLTLYIKNIISIYDQCTKLSMRYTLFPQHILVPTSCTSRVGQPHGPGAAHHILHWTGWAL